METRRGSLAKLKLDLLHRLLDVLDLPRGSGDKVRAVLACLGQRGQGCTLPPCSTLRPGTVDTSTSTRLHPDCCFRPPRWSGCWSFWRSPRP